MGNQFKVGDKIRVKDGVDEYGYTNTGSVGIITRLYKNDGTSW